MYLYSPREDLERSLWCSGKAGVPPYYPNGLWPEGLAVLHCWPYTFPSLRILKKQEDTVREDAIQVDRPAKKKPCCGW